MLASRVRSLLVRNGVAILSFLLETAVITFIVRLLLAEGSFKLCWWYNAEKGKGEKACQEVIKEV